MPFLPDQITETHVRNAVARIQRDDIRLIPSTRFYVIVDGQLYPPKEVMRYAHEELNGEKNWLLPGGRRTNGYLERMGFEIQEKDEIANGVKAFLEEYKSHIEETKLEDELYKWRLLKQFRGRPNLSADNFAAEIRSVKYSNLIYRLANGVLTHIIRERPEQYREAFRNLFNEKIALAERIVQFQEEVLRIYRELEPLKPHHHDERTIATFLTFHNPEQYTFYKDAFYQKFCSLLGVQPKKKGEKYLHYLELVDEFIGEYLIEDEELLSTVNALLTDDCFKDPQHKILAQDVLYQTFDKKEEHEAPMREIEAVVSSRPTPMPVLEPIVNIHPLNSILYGPPGTGKTYTSIEKAVEVALGSTNGKALTTHTDRKREFDRLRSEGQIEFATFHQNYSYEDFMVGIRPDVNHDQLRFQRQEGVFHQIATRARKNYENGSVAASEPTKSDQTPEDSVGQHSPIAGAFEPKKNFVLVIDEINRANISRVFGELITLLEDDKRLGADNELRVSLPNGEKDFAVPPNLYIIGTMNTADKSIALIDIALRRRFTFISYYPDYDLVKGPEAAALLKHINDRIFAVKQSVDYLIGHAYFMKDEPIETVLRTKILPLLMEYFSNNTKIVCDIFDGSDFTVAYESFDWKIT